MIFPDRLDIPDAVVGIARTLEDAGHEAWCVGGALRDALIGDPQSDYDLATSATPDEVCRLFRRTIAVGLKYGTVGVLDRDRRLHEITTFRRDVETDGRHAVVAFGVSLEDDLARRDFTINAIAYHPLRAEWRDPFDGASDLDSRLIRAVGVPAERFREDHLRVLRAVRFAARLDFAIEQKTWVAARAAGGLETLSAERVRGEWFKGIRTARSLARLVSLWVDVGAAAVWLPELSAELVPEGDVDLQLSAGTRDPVIITALVTRDPVGALRRLKASNAEIAHVAAIVAGPPEPADASPREVRRWLAAVSDAADDLYLLWRLRRPNEIPAWEPVARGIRHREEPLSRGDLAISGDDLVRLGLSGPAVGSVLDRLLDRVLDDPAQNRRELLLAQALTLAQEPH